MDQYFTLLFSGDVELNPGPANYTKNTKSNAREDIPDFSDILIRLEKKIDDGQESMLQNQTQMLPRLSSIEKEIETFKMDLDNLKKKQIIIIIIIIIIILYFYRVIQSAINIAAIKRSPV